MLYWELDSPTRLGHHKSISTMKGKWTVSALNQVFTLKENTKFGFKIMQEKDPLCKKVGVKVAPQTNEGIFLCKYFEECWAFLGRFSMS